MVKRSSSSIKLPNSRAKKLKPSHNSLIMRKVKTYIVSRSTEDWHNAHGSTAETMTEIRGFYPTLREANHAAKRDLLDGWGKDFFEEYEWEADGGFISVTATCPEGEVMEVSVERQITKVPVGPTFLVMKTVSREDEHYTVDSVHTTLTSAKSKLAHLAEEFEAREENQEKDIVVGENIDDDVKENRPYDATCHERMDGKRVSWVYGYISRERTYHIDEDYDAESDPGSAVYSTDEEEKEEGGGSENEVINLADESDEE